MAKHARKIYTELGRTLTISTLAEGGGTDWTQAIQALATHHSERLALLAPPTGKVSIVLDTDTYNEIDDQFAIVYALLSPERIALEALYAAPFHNSRSDSPADGMERSYAEIERVLERMGRSGAAPIYRGSTRWMTARDDVVRGAKSGAGHRAAHHHVQHAQWHRVSRCKREWFLRCRRHRPACTRGDHRSACSDRRARRGSGGTPSPRGRPRSRRAPCRRAP